ncbi:hypothetical protein ABKN59_002174 [Abortiporus biennis]
MYQEQLERIRSPPPAYDEQSGPSVAPNSSLSIQGHPELHRSVSNVSLVPSSSTAQNLVDPYQLIARQQYDVNYETSRVVPPNAEPVVLTWTPPNIEPTPSTSRQSQSRHIYHETPYPLSTSSEPVMFSFSPISTNAMILVPPATYPDSRPLYHISWREDYFNPGSFITTIRRGGHEGGRYVGEFDLKKNSRAASVRIGNLEKWVADVTSVLSKSNAVMKWKFGSTELIWDRKGAGMGAGVRLCRLFRESKEFIARFLPPNYHVRNFDAQVCKLEISPRGFQHFDEILISALLMERQKMTGHGVYQIHR